MIIKRLQNLEYYDAQITKVLQYQMSAVSSYIIGPLIITLLFYTQVPLRILTIWLVFQISLYMLRIFITSKIMFCIDHKKTSKKKRYLLYFFSIIGLNAFLWGAITYPILVYTQESYIYLLLSILLILITGSLATLITVYHGVFIYLVTITTTFAIVLILNGVIYSHFIVFLAIIIYLVVTIPASFVLYSTMEENIEKTREISDLNKSLSQKVLDSTRDLEKAQKLAKIGFWSLDINNQKLSWSDEIYSILGMVKRNERELNIRDFLSCIDEDNGLLMAEEYNKHLENQKDYSIILKIKTREGHIKWIEKKCETSFDMMNRPLVSVGTIQDITDKKSRELAQKDQEKILYQQSRLAQMGEMISMIAHQWRQPLSAISATSTALNLKARRGKLTDEMVLEKTKNITEYSHHLSSTIDDFREFFKPTKEKREVNYNELIASVLNIINVSLKDKNIHLIQELNATQTVLTYPNELKQVILNLIKNAEDILCDKEIQNPYIKIKTYTLPINLENLNHEKTSQAMVLEISDNGGGVPEEIIEQIFDPYFSTKDDQNGTGLGLYMSKTIIEEHCLGHLIVSNNSDGASFKIILCTNESNNKKEEMKNE